jgi:hypothetical protein
MKSLKKQEAVPSLDDILKLSLGGDAYYWVMTKMMKAVVGSSVWNKRYFKELVSEFATDSDESFLVVVIENNYKRWLEEAEHKVKHTIVDDNDDDDDEAWREKLSKAKFTNSGSSSSTGNGSNKRCGGWSRVGYLRFNELHVLIKDDRKRRANFELALKKQFEAEHENDGNEIDSEDDNEIMPANDMMGVKQPTIATVPV